MCDNNKYDIYSSCRYLYEKLHNKALSVKLVNVCEITNHADSKTKSEKIPFDSLDSSAFSSVSPL